MLTLFVCIVKDHASVCMRNTVSVVKVSENSLYLPFFKILFCLLTEHMGTYCIDFNAQ